MVIDNTAVKMPTWEIDAASISYHKKDTDAKKHMRFGQWLCLTYKIRDQYLFYVVDSKRAYDHIIANYSIEG